MTHYRNLNKELVEQVQTMRQNMKLYCDEIVYLKRELFQKHESEINLRKQCYNWVVNSFLQLIQSIQPDSEILPILEDHINSNERISSTSSRREEPWTTGRPDMRRHSSLLSREFQRSSSVINLRKSVCSTSPVRRSNNEASDEEEEKSSPDMPSNDEVEIDKNTDAAPCEIPRTAVNIDDIIFEESDVEEEEEIYNCEDMDVESVYESVEEVSINISEKRCTLSDVTNMLKSTKLSSTKYSIQEKITNNSTAKKTKDKDLRGKENFTNEGYTTSKENYGIDVTKKLSKRGQEKFAENSNQSIEEETLQEPRRYSNSGRNFDTNKSFPFNQNHGQISNNEVTLSSTTLVLNDMTLRNFKEAACSTPNSRQNSLEGTKVTNCESTTSIQTSSTTSIRPSRQCKPKNLAEPQLGTKLRNESATKPTRKSSRKSKTKPKTKK